MSNADWATKDFYQVLGVSKDADAKEIKKAYRKLARENHPDSNPGDAAKHDRFKQVAEAYDVVGDAKKRKEYDEIRAAYAGGGFGGGFPGGFPGGFGGGTAGGTPDLRPQRHLRRHVRGWRRWWPAYPRAAAAAPWRRPRDRGHDRVRGGDRGHHAAAAAQLRRALQQLPGHRRRAGHPPAHLPDLRGQRHGGLVGGRRVPDERDLPRVPRPPARVRRGLPGLPRQRARRVQPHDPGPDPGRGQGRPEDPAQGQGCRRRAGRVGRRPVRGGQGASAPAVPAQGRQPHPRRAGALRRGRARCRDHGAHAQRCSGEGADPGGHAQRARVPGAWPRGAASRRHRGRPAGHRQVVEVPATLSDAQREAAEAYRRASDGADPRAALLEDEKVRS